MEKEYVTTEKNITLPTSVEFGNRHLIIPDDITAKECAKLSIVLGFASAGVLAGAQQSDVDSWLENLGVSRLFITQRK